jgi:Dicarboxylate carrier protein MatC N-terminus
VSIHVAGIIGLVVVFLIGTLRSISLGALALVMMFVHGTIWMRVLLPARDVYGAATTVPGLSVLFDPMELQKVQWESIRPEISSRLLR